MKKKQIRKKSEFWAVVCEAVGICGAFCTLREAREFNKKIKDCPEKHRFRKCEIKIISSLKGGKNEKRKAKNDDL